MRLSKYEKETIILTSEGEDTIKICKQPLSADSRATFSGQSGPY